MFGKKLSPAATASVILLAIASACGVPASAQVRTLTTMDAVSLAIGKNAQIRIASLEARRSEEGVREAWGALLPTLSAEATYTRYMELPVMFFPTISVDAATGSFSFTEPSTAMEMGAKNEYIASLGAVMPLFRADVYAGIRAARAREHMATEDVRAGKADIIAAVKRTYANILLLRAQQDVVAQSITRLEETLHEARNLFLQGFATDVDTLRAFVTWENQKPAFIKLENAIASSTTMLKTLIGLPSDEDIVLADSLDYHPGVAASYATAYRSALAARPDLMKLSHQAAAAEALKDAEAAAHLPSLSLFGRVQTQDQQNDFAFSRYTWPVSSMVGLQVSIPLFNGYRTASRVEQAELSRIQTETALEQMKETAGAEIQIALGNRAEAERRLASSAATAQAAERSYQKTRSRWQQGLCRQIEVSDANLMLNQARLDRLQAITDCIVARTEFEKAAGLLVP